MDPQVKRHTLSAGSYITPVPQGGAKQFVKSHLDQPVLFHDNEDLHPEHQHPVDVAQGDAKQFLGGFAQAHSLDEAYDKTKKLLQYLVLKLGDAAEKQKSNPGAPAQARPKSSSYDVISISI